MKDYYIDFVSEYHKKEVAKIRMWLAQAKGIGRMSLETYMLWGAFSETMSASFLVVDDNTLKQFYAWLISEENIAVNENSDSEDFNLFIHEKQDE